MDNETTSPEETKEKTTDQPAEQSSAISDSAKHSCAHFCQSYMTIFWGLVLGSVIIGCSIVYGAQIISKAGGLSGGDVLSATTSAPAAPSAPSAVATPTPGQPVTVADRSGEPVLGNANAKVTMIEFGDFQCPYCKAYYQQTFNQIKTNYIDTGKIKYIYRYFPLTQIHINAQIAAEAGECANEEGQFWAYHDLLYTDGQSDGTGLDKASLEQYASTLGLNKGTLGFGTNKFNNCLDSNSTLPIVTADQNEGLKDGVNGTPSFFINGQLIVGADPYSTFQQALDKALADAK